MTHLATIFLGQRRRGDGLARAEEGSGKESARASAFFEKIGGYQLTTKLTSIYLLPQLVIRLKF